MPVKNFFALVCVFICSLSFAHAAWQHEGTVVPDSEWRKSDGDFGVALMLTSDPDEFMENWQKDTFGVNMTGATMVERDGVIAGFLIFFGCTQGSDGFCDLEVDYAVEEPDGTLQLEGDFVEMWSQKPSPAQGYIEMSMNNIGFQLTKDAPLGTYTIHAFIRDNVTTKEYTLVREFLAVEKFAID